MKGLLCSIDPGRDKTGVALVHADGTLEKKCIVRTVDYEQELARLLAGKEIFALVMGTAHAMRSCRSGQKHFLANSDARSPLRSSMRNTRRKWGSSGTGKTTRPKALLASSPRG